MCTWEQRKHFGRDVFLTYVIGFLMAFLFAVILVATIHPGRVAFSNYFQIALGLAIILLSVFWLKLPLFGQSRHILIAVICIVAIVATNCIDPSILLRFSPNRLFTALASGLSVGIVEETLVRGPILFWIWSKLPARTNRYVWTAIISGVLFGMLHLLNLYQTGSIVQLMGQIIASITMGLAAAALFMYTLNLLFPILLHALFDAVSIYLNQGYSITSDSLIMVTTLLSIIVQALVGVYLLVRLSSKAKVK